MSKTLIKRTQTTRNDKYNTWCATRPIMGDFHWFYHFDETTQTGLGSNAINQFWIFNGCRRQILVAKCSELIMLAKYKPYFSLLYELPYPFYLILLHTILFNWIHFIHTHSTRNSCWKQIVELGLCAAGSSQLRIRSVYDGFISLGRL